MLQKVPKSFRLHIGLFGRMNVGKSSILNALTHQYVSIVSDVPGTTTDPVEKPMEFLPLGPVLFIDTAGIDDESALARERIERSQAVIDRVDLALIVTDSKWTEFEHKLCEEFTMRSIPFILVCSKSDLFPASSHFPVEEKKKGSQTIPVSALTGDGISDLRQAIIRNAPEHFIQRPSILGDLIDPEDLVVFVTPIDSEAPKGRLILPQVQCIRDILDLNAFCMVTKENELGAALRQLSRPPKLVVTDSQAFEKVASQTPLHVAMTSFSILFARHQADLSEMVKGALAIDTLQPGDRVLIAEACTHHPTREDIGTVKIPKLLNAHAGGDLSFRNTRGHDFPDLSEISLIIHCGACMWNRREMLSRIMRARSEGVPITNYGLTFAYLLGIFERALQPFPEALHVYQSLRKRKEDGASKK